MKLQKRVRSVKKLGFLTNCNVSFNRDLNWTQLEAHVAKLHDAYEWLPCMFFSLFLVFHQHFLFAYNSLLNLTPVQTADLLRS